MTRSRSTRLAVAVTAVGIAFPVSAGASPTRDSSGSVPPVSAAGTELGGATPSTGGGDDLALILTGGALVLGLGGAGYATQRRHRPRRMAH